VHVDSAELGKIEAEQDEIQIPPMNRVRFEEDEKNEGREIFSSAALAWNGTGLTGGLIV
jgi:hypothetical protein